VVLADDDDDDGGGDGKDNSLNTHVLRMEKRNRIQKYNKETDIDKIDKRFSKSRMLMLLLMLNVECFLYVLAIRACLESSLGRKLEWFWVLFIW